MRAFLLLVTLLFSSFTFAGDIEPYFQALKDSAANYEPDGAVCEQVARLVLKEEFAPDLYEIGLGVEYDIGRDTLGELDVLVKEKSSQKIIMVAEVKCWKNHWQALDKAKVQRDRFMWNLSKYPEKMNFNSFEGWTVHVSDFAQPLLFRSISSGGGVKRGFDQEIDLGLSDLKALRMKLLKCQQNRECARPQARKATM